MGVERSEDEVLLLQAWWGWGWGWRGVKMECCYYRHGGGGGRECFTGESTVFFMTMPVSVSETLVCG